MLFLRSVQSLSPALCDSMDCSTPGFPVHYQLLEPTQTHVHWVGDAIQPSLLCIVKGLSHVWLFATPWGAAHQASLSITNSHCLLKLMSIELVMHSNRFILWSPSSSCLQSFAPSGSFPMSQFFTLSDQSIGVSASASVLPVNVQDWFPLVDWLDLLAVQGTLKSLLQQSQFKSITSSALSFLYGLTFTLIHNYWKNYKLWS